MLLAFLVSLLAGLATSIGGYLATHRRIVERPVLAVALAFSAGAMIFVSFVEMIPLGIDGLTNLGKAAAPAVIGMFFVGMVVVAIIDRLLPAGFNPSLVEGREDELSAHERLDNKRLLRSGALVALVLALHNFPEGMSTFFATYQDVSVGLSLALAVAIHNIPEGIAVAAPVFAATNSRKKAITWATLSGLAEPLGALVAILLLQLFIPEAMFGLIYGLVAGMMVFISFDELLPAAQRYARRPYLVGYGVFAGMAVVALSLVLMT